MTERITRTFTVEWDVWPPFHPYSKTTTHGSLGEAIKAARKMLESGTTHASVQITRREVEVPRG